MSEWLAVEAIVLQRDKEEQAQAIAKLSSESASGDQVPEIKRDLSNEVFEDEDEEESEESDQKKTRQNTIKYDSDEEEEQVKEEEVETSVVIVTNASVDISNLETDEAPITNHLDIVSEEPVSSLDACIEAHGLASPGRSNCVSPASSNGGIYSVRSCNSSN